MALSIYEIERLQRRLQHAAPELRDEIFELANAAANPAPPEPVEFVEVTSSDGIVRVMPAEDYQRLTALELAHVNLRVLTKEQSKQHAKRVKND